MTIEQVVQVVEDETGQKVTAETQLEELGIDSLEFLQLLLSLGIADSAAQNLHTVNDLYLAVQ